MIVDREIYPIWGTETARFDSTLTYFSPLTTILLLVSLSYKAHVRLVDSHIRFAVADSYCTPLNVDCIKTHTIWSARPFLEAEDGPYH